MIEILYFAGTSTERQIDFINTNRIFPQKTKKGNRFKDALFTEKVQTQYIFESGIEIWFLKIQDKLTDQMLSEIIMWLRYIAGVG